MYRPEKEPGPYANAQRAERAPDEPNKIDPRLVQLAKETANLPSKRDLAWKFLRQGMSPEWCSIQFGFPVDGMRRAQEEHQRREAAKRDK